MPPGVRGALIRHVPQATNRPIHIAWQSPDATPLRHGHTLLAWQLSQHTGWDVTAHLGLPTGEVLLASWPALPSHWPRIVRPTLYEVHGLCAGLAIATAALDLANHLAEN
ncbi:esterase [Streptomyces sp. SID11385]|uniref:esterase n=1 Tax=Streptomyces sp. SID11385 TaxID=2706031 RepID=UPI0013CDCED9|nr:esterase [Streptomyces sp. SID11385]NEA37691.1 esterase [Streptomyces sp. SID11385]